MSAALADALRAAGFPGVEREAGLVHARLSALDGEFTAEEAGGVWVLVLSRPVRASEAQLAGWQASHPDTPLDIHRGETRLVLRLAVGDAAGLHRWAALAEAAVLACNGWRRGQRAGGEGM